jgi:hypothetical protein
MNKKIAFPLYFDYVSCIGWMGYDSITQFSFVLLSVDTSNEAPALWRNKFVVSTLQIRPFLILNKIKFLYKG